MLFFYSGAYGQVRPSNTMSVCNTARTIKGEFVEVGYVRGVVVSATDTFDTQGLVNPFVARCNADGIIMWLCVFSGQNAAASQVVVRDSSGNIYVSGWFEDSLRCGETLLTSHGKRDVFLIKLDSHGSCLWAVSVGKDRNDSPKGITVDLNEKRCSVSGYYNAITTQYTCDPEPEEFDISAPPSYGEFFQILYNAESGIYEKTLSKQEKGS